MDRYPEENDHSPHEPPSPDGYGASGGYEEAIAAEGITNGEEPEPDFTQELGPTLDDIAAHFVSPELEAWLEFDEGARLDTVLILPGVPRFIGGLKSNKFEIKDMSASPDAPPGNGPTVDLKNVAVEASGLRAFSDFFSAMEAQADGNYPDALFETQQVLAEVRDSGVDVKVLLVPDTVNHSATDYFRRLARLAQDTGVEVVIRSAGRGFKQFKPPTAESVDAYWEKRYETAKPFPPKELRPESLEEQVVDAFFALPARLEAFRAANSFDYSIRQEFTGYLWTLANANPQTLRVLMSPDDPVSTAIFRDLAAYGADRLPYSKESALARIILAKADDPEGLVALKQELRDKNGGYGYEEALMVPLAIYAQNRPVLMRQFMHRADQLMVEGQQHPDDPTYSGELIHTLGVLYNTYDPTLADYLSSHLEAPPNIDDEYYTRNVLDSALRWLPDYIDILQTAPPSPEQQEALNMIETRVAACLERATTGESGHLAATRWADATAVVAEMLMKFRDPAHQDLLKRHIIAYFEQQGSVLDPQSGSFDNSFARHYLHYREIYGDIADISKHIKITG